MHPGTGATGRRPGRTVGRRRAPGGRRAQAGAGADGRAPAGAGRTVGRRRAPGAGGRRAGAGRRRAPGAGGRLGGRRAQAGAGRAPGGRSGAGGAVPGLGRTSGPPSGRRRGAGMDPGGQQHRGADWLLESQSAPRSGCRRRTSADGRPPGGGPAPAAWTRTVNNARVRMVAAATNRHPGTGTRTLSAGPARRPRRGPGVSATSGCGLVAGRANRHPEAGGRRTSGGRRAPARPGGAGRLRRRRRRPGIVWCGAPDRCRSWDDVLAEQPDGLERLLPAQGPDPEGQLVGAGALPPAALLEGVVGVTTDRPGADPVVEALLRRGRHQLRPVGNTLGMGEGVVVW